MRELSKLTAWSAHNDLPLGVEELLGQARVDAFLDALDGAGIPARSISTYRWIYTTIRDAVAGTARSDVAPSTVAVTFTSAEVAYLRTRAADARSGKARRGFSALVELCVGAGLNGGAEVGCVTPWDVFEDEFGVLWVEVHAVTDGDRAQPPLRVVPVRSTSDGRLRRLVADSKERGDTYLIGGESGDVALRRRRSSDLMAAARKLRWQVPLDPSRLRLTWLVTLLEEGHPLAAVLSAAGLSVVEGLDVAARQLATPTADTLSRLTGGAS